MNALRASSSPSFNLNLISKRAIYKFENPISLNILPFTQKPSSNLSSSIQYFKNEKGFKISTDLSDSAISTDEETETQVVKDDEKFNWYENWYPVMPICDLDKSRPLGKRILGIDVVVWWDKNENDWKVMDDKCPHRLAPLSEGRIDQWGRLLCVYHGWCFAGSGDCKFIPQAPRDGPPIHTSPRACVAVYPSCVQNKILWFWPKSDHQYKDILSKKKPPYIPEIDDPSFTGNMITRDLQYGYEVLTENLMDPAHVPYAHYGIMRVPTPPKSVKADREGGRPLDLTIKTFDINGFTTATPAGGLMVFVPPCLYNAYFSVGQNLGNQSASSTVSEKKAPLVFLCIPVSPGNSRLIFTQPRNFAVWFDRIIPRWIFHIGQNFLLDSDLYLLHVEERKMKEIGSVNWHKACFVPTKADVNVVCFRRWLNKYSDGEVDWGTKFSGELPPTPPREQLMDRYWSHTTICKSCNLAHKSLNAIEIALQVIAFAMVGIVVAAKQGMLSMVARYTLVSTAILFFCASKWLSHFIYKNFHFHDYDHASVSGRTSPIPIIIFI